MLCRRVFTARADEDAEQLEQSMEEDEGSVKEKATKLRAFASLRCVSSARIALTSLRCVLRCDLMQKMHREARRGSFREGVRVLAQRAERQTVRRRSFASSSVFVPFGYVCSLRACVVCHTRTPHTDTLHSHVLHALSQDDDNAKKLAGLKALLPIEQLGLWLMVDQLIFTEESV